MNDEKKYDGKADYEWFFEYETKFKETVPLLYMQGMNDDDQVALVRKAIDRGAPLDDSDFDIPEDVDTFY